MKRADKKYASIRMVRDFVECMGMCICVIAVIESIIYWLFS